MSFLLCFDIMSKIDCFGCLWYNDYNLGVVMDLKSVIKKYMDEIRTRFSKKEGEKKPTETSTGLTREQLKELEEKPYNEMLSWVEGCMKKIEQCRKSFFVFENDDEKLVVNHTLFELKKHIHLFPAWKKAGVIEFNGEDFDQIVEYVNSQLFDQHASHRINENYTIKSIKEFLGQKTQLEESLKGLSQSYLTEQINQAVEYMNLIEEVLSKGHQPLQVKNASNKPEYIVLSEEDSHLVQVYLGKIKKIQNELSEIEKYFKRSENLRDEKQLDDFLQKYNLHDEMIHKTGETDPKTGRPKYEFLEKTPAKALHDAIAAMDQKDVTFFETFTPAEPDKFVSVVKSLLDGVSFKKPENFDWESNLTDIINKTFVQNEVFNKILKGEEKVTQENAKQIIEITFDAIKEILSQSYLSLGVNLELKYEDKAPMELALGSNTYTPEMKSQITIYEDTLKTLIETQPSEINLAFILSTMFHETGHAVDTFWNKVAKVRPTSEKIKQLREFAEVEKLGQEDLFFLICLSPSLRDYIEEKGSDKESIESLLKMLNNAEYLESREEYFARVTSADLTKLLYQQLALFYKDDPQTMQRLAAMYHTADKVAGTYYSAAYLEELEKVDSLTDSVFEDFSKIPEDLVPLENLCSDFEETKATNQHAEELNKKRNKVFAKFYSGLSQENKDLLLKRALQEGRIFVLNSIVENNCFFEIPTFETEDMVAYFRKIATVDFDQLPESHVHIASHVASFGIHRSPENIEKLKEVLGVLLEDKNVDELYLFLGRTDNRSLVTEEQLYSLFTSLPEEEKEKKNYRYLLSSMEFSVKRSGEDTPVHKKLLELIEEELKESRHSRKSQTTALIPLK